MCRARLLSVGLVIALFSLALGCAGKKKAADPGIRIIGHVLQVSEAPVVDAMVTVQGTNLSVLTDADGYFELTGVPTTRPAVLQARADGYAKTFRRMDATMGIDLNTVLHLKAVDLITSVAMGGDPVTIQRGTGQIVLTIPADSLVDQDGNTVSGEIDAQVTYWNPQEEGALPADLLAAEPDGTVPMDGLTALLSVGMTEIELTQAGSPLQVASGSVLQLDMTVPDAYQAALADTTAELPLESPRLYWLNEETGLWQEEVNSFTYEGGVLKGELPHLSTWNGDVPLPRVGGCVKGTVATSCGGGAPGAAVTVVFDRIDLYCTGECEPVTYHINTDASGNFCLELNHSGHSDLTVEASWQGMADGPKPIYEIVMSCGTCDGQCPNDACSDLHDDETPVCESFTQLPTLTMDNDEMTNGQQCVREEGGAVGWNDLDTKLYCCQEGLVCEDNVCVAPQ